MTTGAAGGLVPRDLSLEQGVLRGLVAYRWLTLAWAVVAVIFSRDHLEHPLTAAAALAVGAAWTGLTTAWVLDRVADLMRPAVILIEGAIGVSLLLLDPYVYDTFMGATRRQSLPWAWPHAAIITAAVILGMRAGLVFAAAIAAASFAGETLVHDGYDTWVGVGSKTALYFLAAAGAALVMRRLREAADQISAARAREEMAATLHDGVLQTLAVIQRRSDDTELVELARRQDRELRAHLWGGTESDTALRDTVQTTAGRILDAYALPVQVLIPADLPPLSERTTAALGGAVSEAITNAAKHAGASRVVVFAEPLTDHPEGHLVFCSVNDDGVGFDTAVQPAGRGLRHSIEDRIAAVGGAVEISTAPGAGTEVRFWVRG